MERAEKNEGIILARLCCTFLCGSQSRQRRQGVSVRDIGWGPNAIGIKVMKYYYAVVRKDGDSAYGVHFPDLPCVFSAADKLENVLLNACEALDP